MKPEELKINTLSEIEIKIYFNKLSLEQLQEVMDKIDSKNDYNVEDYRTDYLADANKLFTPRKTIKSTARVVEMNLPYDLTCNISENFITINKTGKFDKYAGMDLYIPEIAKILRVMFEVNPTLSVDFVTIRKINNLFVFDKKEIFMYVSNKYTNLINDSSNEIHLNIENLVKLENNIDGRVTVDIVEGSLEGEKAYQINFELEYGKEYYKPVELEELIKEMRKINSCIFDEYMKTLDNKFFENTKSGNKIVGINENARRD